MLTALSLDDEIRPCKRCSGPRVRVVVSKRTRLICRQCKAAEQRDYYRRNSETLIPKMAESRRRREAVRPNLCECGCGTPVGRRSHFAPGHNGRMTPRRLVCRVCGIDHTDNPEAMVRAAKRRLGRSDTCLVCIRERTRLTVAANRAIVTAFKDRPCQDCGNRYPSYVMDCDHRDPAQKTINVSQLLLSSVTRLWEELDKCDVVCANCHRIRTHGQTPAGFAQAFFESNR